MIRIETATLDDVPAMCPLLAQLFAQESEFTPDAERQRAGLELILKNQDAGLILVARSEQGEVLGMINLLYTVSTYLGAKVALVEDVVVDVAQRNRGIGTKLLSEALLRAKHAGCQRATLLTDTNNEKAATFYQRHGFEKSSMQPMRRLL